MMAVKCQTYTWLWSSKNEKIKVLVFHSSDSKIQNSESKNAKAVFTFLFSKINDDLKVCNFHFLGIVVEMR